MMSVLLNIFHYTNILYDNLRSAIWTNFANVISTITLSSGIFKIFSYIAFCILTIKIRAKSNVSLFSINLTVLLMKLIR